MYHYDYLTKGTCSQVISLDLDGDKVHNVVFMGGSMQLSDDVLEWKE